MESIKKIEIKKGLNLMMIPSDNFKTNIVSIYIQRPLSRDEVTMNSLLPSVLKCGTSKYKTPKELTIKMDELYGSGIGVDVEKKGEKQILTFRLYTTADEYLPEPIFQEALGVLRDVLLDPYKEEGVFKKEYLDVEKENLKERVLGKINNKNRYAIERCVEEMCNEEAYSIDEEGYIEDLPKISSEELYSHYKHVIKTSPIDIVVAGSMDMEKTLEIVKEVMDFEREEIIEIPKEKIEKIPSQVKNIVEEMEVTQGKLVLGYRTNVDYASSDYYGLLMYSTVLGGGAHSKMFLNIREKESLCYYIFSALEKQKGLMFISSGIEVVNYEKALKLIEKEMDDMKNGRISDEEIQNSKKYIVNSLKSARDSLTGLSDFYYNQHISKTNETLNSIMEKIEKVNKEDIIKASEKIYLDTSYFLKGHEEAEEAEND